MVAKRSFYYMGGARYAGQVASLEAAARIWESEDPGLRPWVDGMWAGSFQWAATATQAGAAQTLVDFQLGTYRLTGTTHPCQDKDYPEFFLYIRRLNIQAIPANTEASNLIRQLGRTGLSWAPQGTGAGAFPQPTGHCGSYGTAPVGISNDATAAAIVYARSGALTTPARAVRVNVPIFADLKNDTEVKLLLTGATSAFTADCPLIITGDVVYLTREAVLEQGYCQGAAVSCGCDPNSLEAVPSASPGGKNVIQWAR